jgi:hypothetical protein
MAEYLYTRELVNGAYDIDNPLRVDGEGFQIHLATEIVAALPGKVFKEYCNGTECKLVFVDTLTSGEETTLTNTVTTHKNNT